MAAKKLFFVFVLLILTSLTLKQKFLNYVRADEASEDNLHKNKRIINWPPFWQKISLDFSGPYPSREYCLIVVDDYSRYPVVELVRTISAAVKT